jgi:poly [ADP-ribose] polymerase
MHQLQEKWIYLAPRAKKSINYTDISGSVWAKGKKHRAYLAVYKTAYNNAKDIYTWTSSMTGYRASNIFPNDAVFAHKGSSLINDEVIIYREEQLTIQYLIELQI